MTWEQFIVGEPCPGCGRPYRDAGWGFKGAMNFTDEERARYEAEGARYMLDHPDCQSHRHTVAGYLNLHCGKCCPPPLSPEQRQKIGQLLSIRTHPAQLMRWRLRLYCGHVVELDLTLDRSLHAQDAAFSGSMSCPEPRPGDCWTARPSDLSGNRPGARCWPRHTCGG